MASTAASDRDTGSLKPVLDVLPDSVYDNPTWRGLAYFSRDLVLYAAAVFGLIVVRNVYLDVLLIVVTSWLIAALFIVGHDAAHGSLFKSRRLSRLVGVASFLPSLHVYEGWVLGHNRIHHAFTVREGYDFVWHPLTPEQYRALSTWGRVLHHLEWSWAGTGLYYLHRVWGAKMIFARFPARWARAINRDRLIVIGFVVLSAGILAGVDLWRGASVLGALWLVARVLVLPFIGFSWIIGWAVHVHHVAPDIRWWRRAEWTKFKAQVEGTTVLRAPKGANFLLHWIMVHVPHHVDMRVPMYHLEEAAAAIEAAFPGTVIDKKLRWRDFVANTRACKLYDFDAGRWTTYAEVRTSA
ncbi:MAG: fatty acid desaturase [Acidimicrobiaceae bacterium]|nr:fatty acid desaturase [Acidimicrobiaceae bacterium]